MTKKERLALIKEGLEKTYPDADCSLQYIDPWELLVSAILATQCTDKRVNMVTPALFERYKTVYDFALADEEELQGYIRSTGFYNHKAKNIIAAAQRICSVYGGKVPDPTRVQLKILSPACTSRARILHCAFAEMYFMPRRRRLQACAVNL